MSAKKRQEDAPVNDIRPELMAVVRRAAMVAYVHAKDPPRLDDMATSLDAGVTPQMLNAWRLEDAWDVRRGDLLDQESLARVEAERRSVNARAAIEDLHDRALRAQRFLKPKTWEAAAGLQLRCAETLRQLAEDDSRRTQVKQEAEAPLPDVPKDLWSDLTEEQWQAMAHAALSSAHKPDGGAN